jgi:hypothetical protein
VVTGVIFVINKEILIDILKYKKSDDILKDCPEIGQMECFRQYMQDAEGSIPLTPLFIYVIYLYTLDSPINKRPILDLKIRKVRAAEIAGLDVENKVVQEMVFGLGSEKVRNLIHEYLTSQQSILWTERCTLETQIEESQRIRLKPISSEGDKDALDAFNKKSAATKNFTEWYQNLKKIDAEIFANDHTEVRDSVKKKRVTLESYLNHKN